MEGSVSNQVNFSEKEMMKYSRNIMLADIGVEGQRLLKNSTVTIIGVGGLGCPAAENLVRAGVGTIGLIDDDIINISNIHRQSLFNSKDIKKLKVSVAAKKLKEINPLTKKLMPYANALQYADNQELITKNLNKFKEYDPVDDKDREKFEKYQAEIPDVSLHGFSALEKLGAANLGPIVCEEQISITQSSSPLLLSVVGRTDFAFGGSLDATIPSLIVELKTSWSKLGKIRKDGSRGFISFRVRITI